MLFNTNAFIFVFVPVCLAGFYLIKASAGLRSSYAFLSFMSIVFYGYWDYRFVPLLLASILVNFALGWQLIRCERHWLLPVGIAFNLGLLGLFKYANFLADNLGALTGEPLSIPQIVLPIGISFFTFQQIAFLVDVRRGLIRELWLPSYALFVSFFPQLIAGPIVHYREMMRQFQARERGGPDLTLVAVGLVIFSIGLFKKTVIADQLATVASPIFARAVDIGVVNVFNGWLGALAYTFQIYFDFSGYSDMAVGLGLLFGIRLPINFNSPYKAVSITEFWRRWHMTLSRFLRDYLYIPLGGNRRGPVLRYRNLMLTMLLGGLWHGAAWTFVIWGALHGIYLVLDHIWDRVVGPVRSRGARAFGWAVTFLAVVVAWVIFRAPTLDAALAMYKGMFLVNGLALPLELSGLIHRLGLDPDALGIAFFAENSRQDFYLGIVAILAAATVAWGMPNTCQVTRRFAPVTDFDAVAATWQPRDGAGRWRGLSRFALALHPGHAAFAAVLFFASVRAINIATETEFLYFQF